MTGVRYRLEDLERVFFSTRFSRVLDPFGYVRLMRWLASLLRRGGGLVRREAALWLHVGTLTVEHGETLSRHDVEVAPGTGKLWAITRS